MVRIVNDPNKQQEVAKPGLDLSSASVSRTVTFRGLSPDNLPMLLDRDRTLIRTTEEPGQELGRDLNPEASFTMVLSGQAGFTGLTPGEIGIGGSLQREEAGNRSHIVGGIPSGVRLYGTVSTTTGIHRSNEDSRRSTNYDFRRSQS